MKNLLNHNFFLYAIFAVAMLPYSICSYAEDNVRIESYSKKAIVPDAVTFVPDGHFALSAKKGVVSFWDLYEGRLSRTVGRHDERMANAVFSPKANMVLFGEVFWDKVMLWDLVTGQLKKSVKLPIRGAGCAVFSPDEKHVLFGYRDLKDERNIPFLWKINEEAGIFFKGEGHMDRITSVAFSPDGKLAATGSKDFTVKLWDVETGQEIATLEGHSESVIALLFTRDQRLISLSNYSIRLWDIKSGNEIRVFERPHNFAIHYLQGPLIISPDGRHVYCGSEVYEYPSGAHIRSSLKLNDDFALSGDGKKIISISKGDANIKIFDARLGIDLSKKATELRIEINAGSDKRSEIEKILYGVIYKKLDNLTFTASITQFEGEEWVIMTPEGYYSGSPDAVKFLKVRVGSSIYSMDNFHERFFNPHLILKRLNNKEVEASEDIRKGVAKPPKVKIISPKNGDTVDRQNVEIVVRVKDLGGGVDEIRLYHNESAVGGKARGINIQKGDGDTEATYIINLIPGLNKIRAEGFSRDRTQSDSSLIELSYNKVAGSAKLYLVTIGVNEYKNPEMRLNYAVADATAIKNFFRSNWENLFNGIYLEEIYNEKASRKNIKSRITELGALEEDVVVIYLAGHGANIGDEWYFLGYDVIYPENENEVIQKSISSNELKEMITSIRSLKKLIIIDACKSGKMLDAFSRGVEDRKSLYQLARSTGTHIIAASTSKQYASEIPQLGHGLFTYALLKGLDGRWVKSSNTITVRELIAYVEKELPGISEKYRQQPQYPVIDSRGQDFPLVVIK